MLVHRINTKYTKVRSDYVNKLKSFWQTGTKKKRTDNHDRKQLKSSTWSNPKLTADSLEERQEDCLLRQLGIVSHRKL